MNNDCEKCYEKLYLPQFFAALISNYPFHCHPGFTLSPLAILVWVLNVVCDTVGHVALKFAATKEIESNSEWERWKAMLTSGALWLGIFCFCFEFVLWLVFLSVLTLSQGVLLGAINMVSIVLAGRFIFFERIDAMRFVGILLITLGVVLVGLYA